MRYFPANTDHDMQFKTESQVLQIIFSIQINL